MGRVREFDTDEVLDVALRLFWRDGYDRASIPQLERETGLGRQSLYLAFGDKKALFLKALDRYADRYIGVACKLLSTETPANGLRGMFDLIDRRMHAPENPSGCLITNATLELEAGDPEIVECVHGHLRRLQAAIEAAIRRGIADGSLSVSIDPNDEALMLMATTRGISVLHRGGYQPEDLVAVRDQSLARLGIRSSGEIPASAST